MSNNLVQDLVHDLQPSPRRWPVALILVVWLTLSALYVGLLAGLLGPYRPGVLDQLASHPRFAFEMLAGAGAATLFACAGFKASIPGTPTRWWSLAAAVALMVWLLHFVLGGQFTVLEAAMSGKRSHCAFEAYLYSVPPTLAALWLQQRRYPLRPLRALLHSTVAAGLLGALVMQVACMYQPEHILKFHVLPVALLAIVVACVYRFIRRP